MSYTFRRLLNQLPLALAVRSDRRLRGTGLKHAQFASFLEDTGFRTVNVDSYTRGMRRRRLVKALLLGATALAFAWVAIESARAVALF